MGVEPVARVSPLVQEEGMARQPAGRILLGEIMKKLLLGLAVFIGAPAAAVTVLPTPVVTNGKLTGANGVRFDGQVYNVTFKAGSCVDLFSGCDQASDFDFTTQVKATQAAQALLDQVFVTLGGVNYDIDSNPVFGCAGGYVCVSYIPYASGNDGLVSTAYASNFRDAIPDDVGLGSVRSSVNFGGTTTGNYARFTLANAGAVPEPATWAMMIGGFGLIGAARRRRVRATAAVA